MDKHHHQHHYADVIDPYVDDLECVCSPDYHTPAFSNDDHIVVSNN